MLSWSFYLMTTFINTLNLPTGLFETMILLFLLCAYNSYGQFEWLDVNSSVNATVLGNY